MPVAANMWIKNFDSSELKGSVTQKGREGSIEVHAFEHEVRIPTDPHTGALTGRRIHEAVKVVKPYDASSTYLYKTCCEGLTLAEVKIGWYRIEAGQIDEVLYFSHLLKNARITSVKPIMYNVKDLAKERYVHLEEVLLRYESIEWTYTDGSLTFVDCWDSNV